MIEAVFYVYDTLFCIALFEAFVRLIRRRTTRIAS